MAVERMPITPEVLTWARERAGYSLDDLASKRSDFKRVAEWESGEASPSYRDLEVLSGLFEVPTAIFFFPNPPDLPLPSRRFKTLDADAFDHFPPRLQRLLYETENHQRYCSRLRSYSWDAQRLLVEDLRFPLDASVESIASALRDYLGVSFALQSSWANAQTQFEHWRSALFCVGVDVYKLAFRMNDCAGFCLYDRKHPIICVNSDGTWTSQTFTLFHSLGHLLFETSGIDARGDQFVNSEIGGHVRIDEITRRLAPCVVLPDALVTAKFNELGRDSLDSKASLLSELFSVDRDWMNRRLCQLALAPDIVSLETSPRHERESPASCDEPKGPEDTVHQLGEDYIRTVFHHFAQDHFDEDELAAYLCLPSRDVERVAEHLGLWRL